jgi:hypothetical protein
MGTLHRRFRSSRFFALFRGGQKKGHFWVKNAKNAEMPEICNFAKNGDFSHFGEKCDFS